MGSDCPKMRETVGNKKFFARCEYANFAMQYTVLFDDDMELLTHMSDGESDKSFNELGNVCINDTCDSPKQEGSSKMDKSLVCKIDQITYPLFTPNNWYGNSCSLCTIDNNKSGLFDSKEIGETFTGIAG